MSSSDNTLTVETADAAAEISVFDGSLNEVARGVGGLQKDLTPGIYKLRVRVGPSFREELVALDQNRKVRIDSIPFASPIPLAGTSRSHEYHQRAAIEASAKPLASFGSGASILVFAREWSAGKEKSQSNPAAGLIFSDEAGEHAESIADKADVRTDGDPSAGWRADVAPGAYRLKLRFTDGSGLERPLFATAGKQTQLFLLQRDHTLQDGTVERRADLMGGQVTISPTQSFNPQDRLVRLSELASYALTQSRRILSGTVAHEVVSGKFEDPMLGLIGAHLILRDNPRGLKENSTAQREFDIVTDNLLRLLGPDHPDLATLWWSRSDGKPLGDGRLHALPMLRHSWDLAIQKSFQSADVIALPKTSFAATVGILAAAPWLLWRSDEKAATSAESSDLSQTLGDYLRARTRSAGLRAARLAEKTGQSGGQRETAAPGPVTRGFRPLSWSESTPSPESDAPAATAPDHVPLEHDEKVEVARTLGVPSQVLDEMLRRFSR